MKRQYVYWMIITLLLMAIVLVTVIDQRESSQIRLPSKEPMQSKYIGVWQARKGSYKIDLLVNKDGSGVMAGTSSLSAEKKKILDCTDQILWNVKGDQIIIKDLYPPEDQADYVTSGSLNDSGDGLALKSNHGELLTGSKIFYRQHQKYVGVWQARRGSAQITVTISKGGGKGTVFVISEKNPYGLCEEIEWWVEGNRLCIQGRAGSDVNMTGVPTSGSDGLVFASVHGELIAGDSIFYCQTAYNQRGGE